MKMFLHGKYTLTPKDETRKIVTMYLKSSEAKFMYKNHSKLGFQGWSLVERMTLGEIKDKQA